MDAVLTLIGAPGSSAIDGALVAAARAGLAEAGATAGAPDWLNPGAACDIPFEGVRPATAEAAVRARLAGAPADLAAQAAEGRRKALLVADMESTVIAQEMIDELAEAAGVHAPIAELTRRAMAGELDFATALEARVALLKGLPAETLA
ncbi:MAG: phosphoserine phosphatase SerB, partial [Kiloniellaceae bacterium]